MDVEYLEGTNGNLWVKKKSWLLKRYGLFVNNVHVDKLHLIQLSRIYSWKPCN